MNISDVAKNQKSFIFGSKFTGELMLYDISTEDIVNMKLPKLMKNANIVNAKFTPDCQQIFIQYDNRKFLFYNVKY